MFISRSRPITRKFYLQNVFLQIGILSSNQHELHLLLWHIDKLLIAILTRSNGIHWMEIILIIYIYIYMLSINRIVKKNIISS